MKSAEARRLVKIFLLRTILCRRKREKRKSGDSNDDEKRIPRNENRCACCLKPFYLDRGVRCKDCGSKSCRKGCSRWDASDKAWYCLFCRQQRYWLKKNEHEFAGPIEEKDVHRYFDTAKSRVYVAGVENAAASSGQSLATEREEASTMETIRDFVEKIVEDLIGNLNDTPINRLYDHPAYKPNADSPTMAHTALREIVERAVEEARKLPGLGSSGSTGTGRPQEGRNIVEHSYEDILATAILNKVIEKFQKEQVDGNRNVLHGKPVSAANCALSESETGLDEGVEEGCSSLEPLSQDDCSSDCGASGSRYVRNQREPLSLTIEERIEEVTTTYASDEDHRGNDVLAIRNTHRVPFPELGMDIIDPSQESGDSQDETDTPTVHIDLVSPIESWEENWLFQKRRVQTQADPVAMLVPNPSADFKALIGDKDAEDTSDLSDCSSAQSDEEIEKELIEAINNVVPRSPKKKEFENGLDRYSSSSSDDLSFKENCEKRDFSLQDPRVSELKIEQKTDSGETEEPNEIIKRSKDKDNRVRSLSLRENEQELAKDVEESEIEKKSKRVETEKEIPVAESIDVIVNGLNKIETERRTTNGGSREDETVDESSITDDRSKERDSVSVEKSDLVGDDLSRSRDSIERSTVSSSEKIVPDVPKTPACTPTGVSVVENRLENENNEETLVSPEESVLNSLECAKKKLMAVNDANVEAFREEKQGPGQQKADLQGEDVQQESEYTEHYDIATQRHLDSLTKTEPSECLALKNSGENNERTCREAVALAKAESASHLFLQNKKSEEEVRLAAPPRPGTIAEREHKKWENAPPIENNPYSQENIQKRLWERQYSRRSSDIPGINAELPKSNGEDLDAMLAPHEPDMKRFGRDYYINDSRVSSNEKGRRSAASTASRPSSSLSQRSSSTGIADQDQQEETQYRETESLLNRSNDVKSKVAKWQNNNSQDKYQSPVQPNGTSNETERSNGTFPKKIECERSWEDERLEMLENERKNNKNEVNAKLNNQENYKNSVLDAKKFNSDDHQRRIKRIDLRAYGFEDQFFSGKTIKTSTPRVVNKLDLKSFGYDQGIRRTRSNIQLSSIDSGEFGSRFFRVANKSNLTRRNNLEDDDRCNVIENSRASGDNILTQSTEALNKFDDGSYVDYGLKSAKSVPDIAKYYSNASNRDDEEVEEEGYSQNSYEFRMIKNGSVRDLANNYNLERCNVKSSGSSVVDSEIDTDVSSEREQSQHSLSDTKKKGSSDEEFDNKVLPMPSVRRLAEAFSKQSESAPALFSKISKSSNVYKERSSTPEIQIIETPRQMHSLTARSLSKQFREGLKQIPNKVTSPPNSHVSKEQPSIPENQMDVVQVKSDNGSNDTNVILPGKLKSNIIFWERIQKKN